MKESNLSRFQAPVGKPCAGDPEDPGAATGHFAQ